MSTAQTHPYSRIAARLHLKDPRVPGTIVLLLLALGCTPATPRYPMGGIKNTLDEDVNIRGRVRGASFDAMVGTRSTLWVIEDEDEDAQVEVYGASGFNIDRHVSFKSLWYNPDRYEVLMTEYGYSVRHVPWRPYDLDQAHQEP